MLVLLHKFRKIDRWDHWETLGPGKLNNEKGIGVQHRAAAK